MTRVDYGGAIEVKDIAKIWINGEEFSGIGYEGLMTVNTKTYVDEPVRSNDGSISNIDDYETFIVPRCKVNFKYFNIQDYMRLCRVLNSANQFPVRFFDKQFGTFVEHQMYAEPEEMKKIYNVGTSVIGLFDYEVSLIGTLNKLEEYEIKYDLSGLTAKTINAYSSETTYNEGTVVSSTKDDKTTYYKYINPTSESGKPLTDTKYWKSISKVVDSVENVPWGHSIKGATAEELTSFYVIPSGKTFIGWNTLANGTGNNLKPNANWSVFESATFHPIFE